MQVLLSITVLTSCVLSALGLPNLSNKLAYEPSLESFQVRLLAGKIDTREMSAAEEKCATNYNRRNNKINERIIYQSNKCFETSLQTTIHNNRTTDHTVTGIRKDIMAIQTKLDSCSKMQDNLDFLNCVTLSYDPNMQFLDRSNSQAYLVMAQINVYQLQVEIARDSCTNSAVVQSKMEMMQNTNEYNTSLNTIPQ